MSAGNERFKVTACFSPAYGGGWDVCVEDLNTGLKEESWCYDKASVSTAAKRIADSMANSAKEAPEVSYIDAGAAVESPAEAAGGSSEAEAAE